MQQQKKRVNLTRKKGKKRKHSVTLIDRIRFILNAKINNLHVSNVACTIGFGVCTSFTLI